jgi:serine/threonine protein kinase
MTTCNGDDGRLELALEDFLTRMDAGETPDPEEYLRRYPDCAGQLREFFDDLDFANAKLGRREIPLPFEGSANDSGRGIQTLEEGSPDSELPHIRGFRLFQELGRGSQGMVYRAEQLSTKRTVALKVIREGAFASDAERHRFENEVELSSRLAHPSIIRIYECGRDRGRHYFAMEYVEGELLDAYLAVRTLTDQEALHLFLELCDGVSFAHQHGVIHRDLKPSNVIVDSEGHAHILDFGLAKPIPKDSEPIAPGVTQVGDFAGTWHYASPEQIKRDPALVDIRSDVYTLGVILYELVTDNYPYPVESASKDAIAQHILDVAPTQPSAIRGDMNNDLETIILQAMHKDPDRRYQSAPALADDIRRYLEGLPIEAKRDSPWYVVSMMLRRHRWRVAGGVVALLALLVFAVTSSILYAQAVAARKTTEVHMEIVRRGQGYVTNKLDELHRTTNVLDRIRHTHPDLLKSERWNKDEYQNLLSLFSPIVADIPEDLSETVRSYGNAGYAEAVEWLSAHEQDLARIAEIAGGHRFVFSAENSTEPYWAAAEPSDSAWAARRVCDAFVARALLRHNAGDHEAAVASLAAALSIALDLGDGRLLVDRSWSISARTAIYGATLHILNTTRPEGTAAEPYITWLLHDPPLPQYRLAFISERQKLSQTLEDASIGGGPRSGGQLDFDKLDEGAGGFFGIIGQLSNEQRRLATQVTPTEVLDAIDQFITEVEKWDDLTFSELASRVTELRSLRAESQAQRFVAPLLPAVIPGFQARGRVNARRTASLLAAYLQRYYARVGRWPATMEDALPTNAVVTNVDPYIGCPFKYRLFDGKPILYSVNEDGQDDGGHTDGEWGESGTDVVFFRSHNP